MNEGVLFHGEFECHESERRGLEAKSEIEARNCSVRNDLYSDILFQLLSRVKQASCLNLSPRIHQAPGLEAVQ